MAGQSYSELVVLDVYDADGDDVTVYLASGAPRGVQLFSSTRKLRWNNVPDTASGTIEVFLSDGQATSSWVPEVKICSCQVKHLFLDWNPKNVKK